MQIQTTIGRASWPSVAIFIGGLVVSVLTPLSCWSQFRRVDTLAGNGQTGESPLNGRATRVTLSNPFGIAEEADGSLLVVSYDQHALYRLDSSYTTLERILGTGSPGFSAEEEVRPLDVQLNQPHEVQVDESGNIYVADTMNHRVGMIVKATGRWRNLAGTGEQGFGGDEGLAIRAKFNQAYSIALEGQNLFVADLQNHRIRLVRLDTGRIQTICGTGEKQMPTDGGLAIEQPLAGPRSLAIDSENLWIVLREGNSVWRIDRRDDRIYRVAGTGEKGYFGDNGAALAARFNGPKGIAVDPQRFVYIADTENHAIRAIDLGSDRISTIIGSPEGRPGYNGEGDSIQNRLLRRPHGLCLLDTGELAIGDSENHRLRILLP